MHTVRNRRGKEGVVSLSGADNAQHGKIRVCIRVRPQNGLEHSQSGSNTCVNVLSNSTVQICTQQDTVQGNNRSSPTLSFDYVAGSGTSQSDFYQGTQVSSMVDASLEGYSSCIFAYGQTGSGKTYSMTGMPGEELHKGIMPRAFEYQFSRIQELSNDGVQFVVRASYMEQYNERIGDQLNAANKDLSLRQKQNGQSALFFVENLSIVQCSSPEDLLAVAVEGHNNRHIASHALNAQSSRSHALLHVYIESRKVELMQNEKQVHWVRHGKLTFVDLAGSENQRSTGILNAQSSADKPTAHVKETASINRSLFSLGAVMNTLSAINTGRKPPNTFIPYRNSKLTMILQDCLGGASLGMMFACISEAPSCSEESKRTLTYASTCRNIKNKPQAELDPRTAMLIQYKEQCATQTDENNLLKSILIKCGIDMNDQTRIADGNITVNSNYGTNSNGHCHSCKKSQDAQLLVLKENAKLRLRIDRIVQSLINLHQKRLIPDELMQQGRENNERELLEIVKKDDLSLNLWDKKDLLVNTEYNSGGNSSRVVSNNDNQKNTTATISSPVISNNTLNPTMLRRSSIDVSLIPLDIQQSVSELQIRTNVLLRSNAALQQRVDLQQEQQMKENSKQPEYDDICDEQNDDHRSSSRRSSSSSYNDSKEQANNDDNKIELQSISNLRLTGSYLFESTNNNNNNNDNNLIENEPTHNETNNLTRILTSRIAEIVQDQRVSRQSSARLSSARSSILSLPSDLDD